MADLKQALKQLKGARDSLVAEITALDTQIADRHAARSRLTSSTVSKEDFLTYVAADMKRRADFFARGLVRAIAAVPKDYGSLQRGNSMGAKLNINYLANAQSPLEMSEAAVYFYFGDALTERLASELDALDWADDAISSAIRAERIAALDAEIEALNKQRDDLAKSLIDAGLAA